MSAYTYEELKSAGLNLRPGEEHLCDQEFFENTVWREYLLKNGKKHPFEEEQRCAVELVLKYPERAEFALGKGWKLIYVEGEPLLHYHAPSGLLTAEWTIDIDHYGRVYLSTGSDHPRGYLPTAFFSMMVRVGYISDALRSRS